MKSIGATFWGLLHLVGCSVGTPTKDVVDRIEVLTAQNNCVGSLNRWHREYHFEQRGNAINKNVISVGYTQPGIDNRKAGRFITEPPQRLMIDDRQYRVASGEFDLETGKFERWECGCNFPPYDVPDPVECRTNER